MNSKRHAQGYGCGDVHKEPDTEERLYTGLLHQSVREVAFLVEQTTHAKRVITFIIGESREGLSRDLLIDVSQFRFAEERDESYRERRVKSSRQKSKVVALSLTYRLNTGAERL